jgi:hypothetical protein
MEMKKASSKPHYFLRSLLSVIFLLAALYCGNIAVFSVWQSAFQKNAPYLDQLELRFWLFSAMSMVFFIAFAWNTVSVIRKINREYRDAQNKGPPE